MLEFGIKFIKQYYIRNLSEENKMFDMLSLCPTELLANLSVM